MCVQILFPYVCAIVEFLSLDNDLKRLQKEHSQQGELFLMFRFLCQRSITNTPSLPYLKISFPKAVSNHQIWYPVDTYNELPL